MIFIRYIPGTVEKAKVEAYGTYTEQFPQDEKNVVFVEGNHSFPTVEERRGKAGELFINPSTKEMWYEYADRPLTTEEELHNVKEENMVLQLAIAELASASEQDKIETQLAIAELAMLVTGGEA